jgi:hypothetical protein
VKRPGREPHHSAPSNAKVKNGGAIPPLQHMYAWHSYYLINFMLIILILRLNVCGAQYKGKGEYVGVYGAL